MREKTTRFQREISGIKNFNLQKTLRILSNRKKIVFIVGSQRSGSTLMLQIFGNDPNARIYGEFSELNSQVGEKIRLNPLRLVKKGIQSNEETFVILKPLVESQNILTLLHYFKHSKALWMYRDYRDSAASYVKYFGMDCGVIDLRHIVKGYIKNWRAEKVSESAKEIVQRYFSENMNPYDAAVLFWYVRNSHFFALHLDKNPHVLMCKYRDLVTSPVTVVSDIYKKLGQSYQEPELIKTIHAKSLSRGLELELSPEIETLAKGMLEKLDKAYQAKNLD